MWVELEEEVVVVEGVVEGRPVVEELVQSDEQHHVFPKYDMQAWLLETAEKKKIKKTSNKFVSSTITNINFRKIKY